MSLGRVSAFSPVGLAIQFSFAFLRITPKITEFHSTNLKTLRSSTIMPSLLCSFFDLITCEIVVFNRAVRQADRHDDSTP